MRTSYQYRKVREKPRDPPVFTTPQPLFDLLNAEFQFNLDAAATRENRKCEWFLDELQDGLTRPWFGSVWCNPPYGRKLHEWCRKARDEATRFYPAYDRDDLCGPCRNVVLLIPASVGTKWWHDLVLPYAEVRFVRGRLAFGDASLSNSRKAKGRDTPPFNSAVVIYRRGQDYGFTGPPVPSQFEEVPRE